MKLTITNKSRGAVGVRPITGYQEIEAGGEFTGEFSDAEAKNLRGNSLVTVKEGEPAAADADADAPEKSDLDLLREQAAGLGITVDDTWSVARLRKEVKKAQG